MQALGIRRNGQYERSTARVVLDGRRYHEPTLAQVGHPVQAALQVPAIARRAAAHLQGFDAREELHGIGQAGGTGQLAGQQLWQQARAQRLVGALQQVLDKGALAPTYESGSQRAAGNGSDGLDGVGHLPARTAQGRVDAHAQQLRFGNLRQHVLRLAQAPIYGLGIGIQPLSKCTILHGLAPLRTPGRLAAPLRHMAAPTTTAVPPLAGADHAVGCQRYLPSSSLSGVWANTLAKLHRVARLTPRITSSALPSLKPASRNAW